MGLLHSTQVAKMFNFSLRKIGISNSMPSKSKNKGNAFEREVAKFLSELYQDPFCRVPNSGAFIGGANTHRKQMLSENQIKSFKGDIVPPDSWCNFNAEAKNYADFPFHLLLSGNCKQLDTWLEQLLAVSEPNDLNILFVKLSRKGKFVAVQSKHTWITDHFMFYSSSKHGDWVLVDFDHFFEHNRDLLKAYSGSISNTSSNNTDTKS
jgi:hypothetical protein